MRCSIMKTFISLTTVIVLAAVFDLSASTLFVSRTGTNPVSPFANWATAATNLQQAVDAAAAGDEIVVTNGHYGAVKVDKPLLLRSLNGPQVTIIDPARQSRCAYLTKGVRVAGFSFTHGFSDSQGGGVFCASSDVFLTNCVIADNRVYTNVNDLAQGNGGGVYGGTLYNCLVASNSAGVFGGGAMASTLYNCTVIGNRAGQQGGGVYSSGATNCIVYFNSASLPFNNHSLAQLNHCCTTPIPTNGVANHTNAPLFVNPARGDLRLLGISPCIDAGDNNLVFGSVDLAGHPRIMRGTVDLGAYEFQGTNAIVFYAWVQHHGVLIDGTTDYDDPDGDGMNNWQEWVCYTCPTNSLLNLRIISAVPSGGNIVVRWKSSPSVNYVLERSTDPGGSFSRVASNLIGQTGEFVYTDANVPGAGPFFYRVGAVPQGPGPIVWAPPLKAQATQASAKP